MTSGLYFVDIVLPNRNKLTLGVLYRPPNDDTKPLEDLKLALNQILLRELILVGDFNLPFIDWSNARALETSANYELPVENLQDNFLTQLGKSPVRENNVLDLLFVTSPNTVKKKISVAAPSDHFSDHNLIMFSIRGSPHERRETQKLHYSFAKADWAHLRDLLCHIPWHCGRRYR